MNKPLDAMKLFPSSLGAKLLDTMKVFFAVDTHKLQHWFNAEYADQLDFLPDEQRHRNDVDLALQLAYGVQPKDAVRWPAGPPWEQRSLVDIGCNTGKTTERFGRLRFQAFGCDINKHALQTARNRSATTKYELIRNSKLPYDDKSFDSAALILVLDNLPDPKTTLYEIYRVLKPKGKLILITRSPIYKLLMFPSNLVNSYKPDALTVKFYWPFEVRRLLDFSGFRNIQIACNGEYPDLLAPFLKGTGKMNFLKSRIVVACEKSH